MIFQTIVGQEIETPTNKKLARAPLYYFNLLVVFLKRTINVNFGIPKVETNSKLNLLNPRDSTQPTIKQGHRVF